MKRNTASILTTACLLTAAFAAVAGCNSDIPYTSNELPIATRTAVDVLPAEAVFAARLSLTETADNELFRPFDEDGKFRFEDKTGEAAARLRDFMEQTGFDPVDDLKEIYVAMEDLEDDASPSVVAYVSIDSDKLVDYVRSQYEQEIRISTYKDATVLQPADSDEVVFGVVNDEIIVAASSRARVEAMIDRLAGSGTSLGDNADMMALIGIVGGGDGWWVIKGLDVELGADEHGDPPFEMGRIGMAVQDIAFSMDVDRDGFDVQAHLIPREGYKAGDLEDLCKGAVAAIKTSGDIPGKLRQDLDGVKIKTVNGAVRVSGRLENASVASL